MNVESIDWQCLQHKGGEGCSDYCKIRAIVCPSCGKPWLTDYDGEYEFKDSTECTHIKFAIFQEDEEIRFFNGCSREELLKHVEPATREMERPAMLAVKEIPEELENEVFFNHNRFNRNLWEKVHFPMADTILVHTDHGMACGPVSFTVFYGAQLGNGEAPP